MKRVLVLVLLSSALSLSIVVYRHVAARRPLASRMDARQLAMFIENAGGMVEGWNDPLGCGSVRLGENWKRNGGDISSLAALGDVGELLIDCAECGDEELRDAAALPQLKSLILAKGRFSSVGLRELQKAPDLRVLSISGTALGSVDFEVFEGFDLHSLRVEGVDDVVLRQLTPLASQRQLIVFEIVNSTIREPSVIDFRSISQLRFLNLGNTRFSDSTLHKSAHLPSVQAVNLSGTTISGSAIGFIESLPELRTLICNDVELSEGDLRRLLELEQLQSLQINGSQFDSVHVPLLSHMKSLRSLSVCRTPVNIDAFEDAQLPANLTTVQCGLGDTLVFDSSWIHNEGYGRVLMMRKSRLFLRGESGFSLRSTGPLF